MAKDMIDSYDKSLAIGPTYQNDIELEKASYFGKYYNDAVAAYNAFIKMEDREGEAAKKKLNEVIENFQNALMIKPDYMAHRLIAISYQNLGDDSNNLKALEAAAEAKPDTVLSWIELGYYFSRNKEYDKAAEYFEKGLKVNPNDVECLTLYAQNLDFADRQAEAIAAYKRALRKNPAAAQALQSLISSLVENPVSGERESAVLQVAGREGSAREGLHLPLIVQHAGA